MVALTSRASWHNSRRSRTDLERWHRATERLNWMRGSTQAADDDDCATVWCKVLRDEAATGQSYDQAREPSNS